jgi:hypothetical protein
MTKTLLSITAFMFLLCGTLPADERTDWVPTATNGEIQYRTQVYENTEACHLEWRDQDQGRGATTFDAEVDYQSKDANHNDERVMKTDRENIVTTPTQTGTSRIGNCFGVLSVRVSAVQRN